MPTMKDKYRINVVFGRVLNTYLSDGTLLKRQFCSSRIVTLTRVNFDTSPYAFCHGNPVMFINASNNHPYDFKKTNGTSKEIKGIDIYRGMPIGFVNGQRLYSSARDIGNIAAGYIAAVNGLSWGLARIGFDGYQSISNERFETEGISTRNAEYYGWVMGRRSTSIFNRIHNFGNSVQSPLNKAANEVMRKAKSGLNYLKSIIGF